MPRPTKDTWIQIRAEREAGASFGELAAKYGVSKTAIVKRANKEGWGDGTDVADLIRRKVNEKITGTMVPADKKAAAIDAAAERAAEIVRRHQKEWEDHRARFGSVPENFEDGKLAKISAEMLKIRQEGERRAWGLDDTKPKMEIVIERSYGQYDHSNAN